MTQDKTLKTQDNVCYIICYCYQCLFCHPPSTLFHPLQEKIVNQKIRELINSLVSVFLSDPFTRITQL